MFLLNPLATFFFVWVASATLLVPAVNSHPHQPPADLAPRFWPTISTNIPEPHAVPLEASRRDAYVRRRDDGVPVYALPRDSDSGEDTDEDIHAALAAAVHANTRRNRNFFPPPANEEATANTRRDGSIESLNITAATALFEYFGNTYLGTPSQPIPMLFDTGSYQMWTASNKCTSGCSTLVIFNTTDSSTFTDLNEEAPTITYQDGTQVTGEYGSDDVTIAGFTATGLQFEFVTGSQASSDSSVSGIVGMAYSQGNSPTTWFETLESDFESFVFSYYIDESDAAGGFVFGGIDSNRLASDPIYVTNEVLYDSRGSSGYIYYDVVLDSVAGNGNEISMSNSILMIVDTGTSLTFLPSTIAESLHSSLSTDKYSFIASSSSETTYYAIDCNAVDSLGNLVLNMSGNLVTFAPSDYLFQTDGSSYCTSAIAGTDSIQSSSSLTDKSGHPIAAILGNSLLKSLYTIFDRANNQVGFGAVSRKSNIQSNLTVSGYTNGKNSAGSTTYRMPQASALGLAVISVTLSLLIGAM